MDATKILDIPLIVTEQYPKGLGSTVEELDISNAVQVFPKTKFSMVLPEVEETMKKLCDGNLTHVVIFGIEVRVKYFMIIYRSERKFHSLYDFLLL